jgi:hypothetical protein
MEAVAFHEEHPIRPVAEWETCGRGERRGRETRAERGNISLAQTVFIGEVDRKSAVVSTLNSHEQSPPHRRCRSWAKNPRRPIRGGARFDMVRFLGMNRPVPPRNLAELLCDLGRVLQRQARREAGPKAASARLRVLRWDCEFALKYVALSRSVQFRAMVEDWPFHRINEAVHAQPGEMCRP